jgi:hypothetical protein
MFAFVRTGFLLSELAYECQAQAEVVRFILKVRMSERELSVLMKSCSRVASIIVSGGSCSDMLNPRDVRQMLSPDPSCLAPLPL